MPATDGAALERVCAGGLSHKLYSRSLMFLDFLTALERQGHKTWTAHRGRSLAEWFDFETVRVVCGSNFELDFRGLLHADRRWIELVFFGSNFDDLHALRLFSRLGRSAGRSAAR